MSGSFSVTTPVAAGEIQAGLQGLRRFGFDHGPVEGLGITLDGRGEEFQHLADAFADLPSDPYDAGSNRFRRYSRLVHLPWKGELSWVPGAADARYGSVTEYDQNGFNPEHRSPRRFPDVPPAVRASPLLKDLLLADLAQVRWRDGFDRSPIYVGVHMVKLAVGGPGDRAVTSPNTLHQDGGDQMFTFVHLVGCHNVAGGENVIAGPEYAGRQPEEVPAEGIRARFVLSEPLETYAVEDHRVSHYVSPIRAADGAHPGERSIFIVGIAPYAPRF